MIKKQCLYLVFGGYLKKIGKDDFTDIQSLEYVGIYESINEAKKAWKSKSIKNIDFANKNFKVIPLFNFFDPAENIASYLKKLEGNNIKIDFLKFKLQDNLLNVIKRFSKYNAGAGVVIHNKKLAGIITERDIVKTIAKNKNNLREIKILEIMTKKVTYISPECKLIDAIETLKSSGFRHLPIYNDNNLKYYGIISYKDFILGN